MEYKDIVLPDYNHCILGTITSILKHYNVETNHKSSEVIDKILIEKNFKNIIFIVLDGMGEHILNNISPNGFFNQNKVDCVTSVYPSTTTAALTTYYTGRPPYETGWIAWSQYFKEYGRALDMFSHKESYLGDNLKNPMMDVFKTLVNYESVYSRIESASPNVKAFEIGPEYSSRRGKRNIIADNLDEIIDSIKDVNEISGDKFVLAYCDNPDSILHKFGTSSKEAADYIKDAEDKIRNLQEYLGEDTVIIISADHGHKDIDKAYTLLDYPEIMECLIMPPSFESRSITFWVKENMRDVFEERFNKVFSEEFWLMTREDFIDKYHFLGTGEKHKKIDDFVGNYMALSVGGSIIRLETFLAAGKPIKKSTHCGLTKQEMEVPVIVLKK